VKKYRLEYYQLPNERRYFWVIEEDNGSTVTLNPDEFNALIKKQKEEVNKQIEEVNNKLKKLNNKILDK
jgi:uncharacterized protein YlzI (FlbEa/FlbD family)